MTVRKIINNQLLLQQKATKATIGDIAVAKDLKDTLIANQEKAAGLAANMIGIAKEIIAVYVGAFPVIMLNPTIVKKSGSYIAEEGCLSLKGARRAERYQFIVVDYQNEKFEFQQQKFTDFTAEVIQHEVDHFFGKII